MQPPAVYATTTPPADAPEGSLAVNPRTGERSEKRGGVWRPLHTLNDLLAKVERLIEMKEEALLLGPDPPCEGQETEDE